MRNNLLLIPVTAVLLLLSLAGSAFTVVDWVISNDAVA